MLCDIIFHFVIKIESICSRNNALYISQTNVQFLLFII